MKQPECDLRDLTDRLSTISTLCQKVWTRITGILTVELKHTSSLTRLVEIQDSHRG